MFKSRTAESPCDYDSSVNTQYTKTIEKTSDFKKRVFPYVEDTRKCVINMNVTIDGKTYPTMGDFVFGLTSLKTLLAKMQKIVRKK